MRARNLPDLESDRFLTASNPNSRLGHAPLKFSGVFANKEGHILGGNQFKFAVEDDFYYIEGSA